MRIVKCVLSKLLVLPQRLHSCSFLGSPDRILFMNPKKEPLWSLRVRVQHPWLEAAGFEVP